MDNSAIYTAFISRFNFFTSMPLSSPSITSIPSTSTLVNLLRDLCFCFVLLLFGNNPNDNDGNYDEDNNNKNDPHLAILPPHFSLQFASASFKL